MRESRIWRCVSTITVRGTMRHENVPNGACVSPYNLREEGIYYQGRDPVMMASLTKFSPGPINHVCPL